MMSVMFFCATCGNIIWDMRLHALAYNHIPNPFMCLPSAHTFSPMTPLEPPISSSEHTSTYGSPLTTISDARSPAKANISSPISFVCEPCARSFSSSTALESHMNSPRHAHHSSYIPAEAFLDGRDGSDDGVGPTNDFGGGDDPYCNNEFTDMEGFKSYVAYPPKHNWCFECSRTFRTEIALALHRSSLAHRDRDLKCPFCKGMFKSPSGIAMHVESGCHRITRHQVTAAVHSMNIVPNISIKRITGPSSLLTTQHTYGATEASFNGKNYGCFLCRKTFRTLNSLNAHLNSPAHDDDEFRCPKCETEFKLISGFIQHVESRSCGMTETPQIVDYNNLTGQFSRLLKM